MMIQMYDPLTVSNIHFNKIGSQGSTGYTSNTNLTSDMNTIVTMDNINVQIGSSNGNYGFPQISPVSGNNQQWSWGGYAIIHTMPSAVAYSVNVTNYNSGTWYNLMAGTSSNFSQTGETTSAILQDYTGQKTYQLILSFNNHIQGLNGGAISITRIA